MYGAAAAGAAGGAAAASHVRRVVLGGPLVQVDESTFMRVVGRNRDKILVVHAEIKGLLYHAHIYATSYKGFTFVTKTKEPLPITPDVEAKKIWIPATLG